MRRWYRSCELTDFQWVFFISWECLLFYLIMFCTLWSPQCGGGEMLRRAWYFYTFCVMIHTYIHPLLSFLQQGFSKIIAKKYCCQVISTGYEKSRSARLLFSGVDVLFRVSLGLRFFPVMLLIIKIVEFLIGALSYHRNSTQVKTVHRPSHYFKKR